MTPSPAGIGPCDIDASSAAAFASASRGMPELAVGALRSFLAAAAPAAPSSTPSVPGSEAGLKLDTEGSETKCRVSDSAGPRCSGFRGSLSGQFEGVTVRVLGAAPSSVRYLSEVFARLRGVPCLLPGVLSRPVAGPEVDADADCARSASTSDPSATVVVCSGDGGGNGRELVITPGVSGSAPDPEGGNSKPCCEDAEGCVANAGVDGLEAADSALAESPGCSWSSAEVDWAVAVSGGDWASC